MLVLKIARVIGLVLSTRALKEKSNLDSDFAEVVKKESFVDKTHHIKDFLESTATSVVVKAPPGSGKSTAIDMLRRFLDIEVDEQGRLRPPNTTNNYLLFKACNLDIMKEDDIVNKHFAQHPVIVVDCQPIRKINSYYELLDIFKRWLREQNNKHNYLLRNKKLWADQIEWNHFEEMRGKNRIKYGPSYMIKKFVRLCELLKLHHKKSVVVLFDDYDAFLDTPELSCNPENDYIVSFLHTFSEEFLKLNQFLDKVLITGRQRDIDAPLYDFSFNFPPNTLFFNYTDSYPLCQMFNRV